eukprot:1522145-Rhodomonas_salina.3
MARGQSILHRSTLNFNLKLAKSHWHWPRPGLELELDSEAMRVAASALTCQCGARGCRSESLRTPQRTLALCKRTLSCNKRVCEASQRPGHALHKHALPVHNQRQETALAVQFVPGMRFLVFDFGVQSWCSSEAVTTDGTLPGLLFCYRITCACTALTCADDATSRALRALFLQDNVRWRSD